MWSLVFGQFDHSVAAAVPRVLGQPPADGAETDNEFRRLAWPIEAKDVNCSSWVVVLERES
jgi:hypothetical protein